MAKLIISLDGNSLGEFSLDKERTTIGRRPTNDVHIDNLAVSGDHAVIVTISGDSFLEDLNSTNGTLVNLKPIKKHVLQHADVIQFGKYQLRYENAAQQKSTAQQHGFENTAVMRPAKVNAPTSQAQDDIKADVVTTTETKQPPQPPVEAAKSASIAAEITAALPAQAGVPKIGRLQILTGSNSGHEVLLNKALTTFGEPGVQVVVINKRPHGYFVSHVEGDKRLLINGQKAGPQAYQLVDHDVIDLVGMKMEFYLA
jgi:pSer/pThr/pTyr-binding forkhead associated (FHA) protein